MIHTIVHLCPQEAGAEEEEEREGGLFSHARGLVTLAVVGGTVGVLTILLGCTWAAWRCRKSGRE